MPLTIAMIRIATLNARSIIRRKYLLRQYLVDHDIDPICIQETWMNKNSNPLYIFGYRWIANAPTDKRGGGVGILIRAGLQFTIEKISDRNSDIEVIFIKLKTESIPLKIGCVYVRVTSKRRKPQIGKTKHIIF